MRTWSAEEEKILCENYNKVTNEELCNLIPRKTFLAIYKKAWKMGYRKTRENEFLNRSIVRRGEKGACWKGGRKKTPKGYMQILLPEHKRADSAGYVMEHIYIYEKETGIEVPENCCIHHLNGIKDDNRIENLCMMLTSAHSTYHNNRRWDNE